MAKLVSSTYGEALFELVAEENTIDSVAEEVKAVSASFLENDELSKLLNHPKLSKEEKVSIIENIFKGRVSDTMTGLLVLLVEKGRENEMENIFKYFLKKVKDYKNIGVAYVSSAVELSAKQKEDVLAKLLETTGYTEFEMHYSVDAALIGGLVIRIGDRIVDSSIRTRLDNMAKCMQKVQLS